MKLTSCLENFKFYSAIEKGLSDNTISSYISDLSILIKFLNSIKIINIDDLNKESIISFLRYSIDVDHIVASTLTRRIISIRVFIKFLIKENLLDNDFTSSISLPKMWKKLPNYLTIEEVNSALNVYKLQIKKPIDFRNRLILEILYSCGVRVSELVNFKIQNINFHDHIITFFGKGQKERIVPIASKVLVILKKYLNKIRPILLKDEYDSNFVFISKNGKKMNRSMIWHMIKRIGRILKINKLLYPHIFRHTFASHLLNNGADLRFIQEMLGHSDINTTQIYTHVCKNKLREIIDKVHPINKILKDRKIKKGKNKI